MKYSHADVMLHENKFLVDGICSNEQIDTVKNEGLENTGGFCKFSVPEIFCRFSVKLQNY